MKGSLILMIVQFVNRQTRYDIRPWRDLLRQVLAAACRSGSHEPSLSGDVCLQISLTFAGPRVMRRINRETRQMDQLTDVLSFPLLDMENGHLREALTDADYDWSRTPRRTLPLGDLMISLDRARVQADEFGHSLEREVAFLAVHGCLHLLGYDHLTENEEAVMTAMQDDVLRQLGLTRDFGGFHE
ncbi:MAG: rRNA maturation RNase YbeY [Eubacteriales bacterium]|nr:rRNA maturation RNase YbeY [Eubacteriales bacterium]MDD3867233.1 rRNA maturation RNase YbeY [Eubacteriales bacterium]MDD4461155.1 rRNA maturation RNase YbeY [Eubacteriales bacterium]